MGKKNKSPKVKNDLETVEKKGGSAIVKGPKAKQNSPVKGKTEKPKNKKAFEKKTLADEKQIENVNSKLAKKKKNENKKVVSPVKEDTKPKEEVEKIVKLSKREKNRIKSKMSKDIAMDGKSKLGLADPKLVARQLNKLKSAAEPLSKNKQRKVLLLEKLQGKLKTKPETKTPNTSMNTDADSDKEDANTSISSDKSKTVKKGKSESKKQKDKLFLFVGNLPADVDEDMIRKLFKGVSIEKIKIPTPKRKKGKRFAYIQFVDDENKQKGLQFHGTMLGERKINVLLSDKSKGKGGLMSANAKLNAERKAVVQTNGSSTNGSPNKTKKKNKNKKAAAKAK